MEPTDPSRELSDLLTDLERLLIKASNAREALKAERNKKKRRRLIQELKEYLRDCAAKFEALHEKLRGADAALAARMRVLLLPCTVTEALLDANTYAPERSRAENILYYKKAVADADRLAATGAYADRIGNTRSDYGAVLLFYREYTEAARHLEVAAGLLQQGAEAEAATRLAKTYAKLGQRRRALRLLQDVTSFMDYDHMTLVGLTSHHLNAMLWRALLTPWGKTPLVRRGIELAEQKGITNTPEYRQLRLCRRLTPWGYKLLLALRPRRLEV